MSSAILAIAFLLISCASGVPSKEFFLNSEAFDSANVRHTSDTLELLMHTSCLKDRIVISFSRQEMLQLRVLSNHVYLEDNQCSFHSNRTHYFAKILFRSMTCGSRRTRHPLSNKTVIDNTVRFIPPALLRMEESDDEDDFNLRSGSGSDEDAGVNELHIIKIPFQCEYTQLPPTTGTTPGYTSTEQLPEAKVKVHIPTRPKLTKHVTADPSFLMDIYDKDTFINPLRRALLSVPEGKLLFVQVKPSSTSVYEKSFLHNCYYHSEMETSANNGIMYFIRNGCPVDPTVEFLDNYQSHGERLFQFRIKRIFKTWTLLRCEVQPCTVGRRQNSPLPECGSQMAYCSSKPYHNTDLVSVAWPYSLRVVDGPSTPFQDQATPPSVEVKGCPQQFVEVPCNCKAEQVSAPSYKAPKGLYDGHEVNIWVVVAVSVLAFVSGAALMTLIWCRLDRCRKMQAIPTTEPSTRFNMYADYLIKSNDAKGMIKASTRML